LFGNKASALTLASCICLCSCGQEERVVIEQDPSTLHYAYYKAGRKHRKKLLTLNQSLARLIGFFIVKLSFG